MKDSEILKECKRFIEKGEETYICIAISSVTSNSFQGKKLREWITKMLNGAAFYDTWVFRNHPKAYSKMCKMEIQRPNSGFKQGRLQWLDWMIAECEKAEALTPTAKADNMFALAA